MKISSNLIYSAISTLEIMCRKVKYSVFNGYSKQYTKSLYGGRVLSYLFCQSWHYSEVIIANCAKAFTTFTVQCSFRKARLSNIGQRKKSPLLRSWEHEADISMLFVRWASKEKRER